MLEDPVLASVHLLSTQKHFIIQKLSVDDLIGFDTFFNEGHFASSCDSVTAVVMETSAHTVADRLIGCTQNPLSSPGSFSDQTYHFDD